MQHPLRSAPLIAAVCLIAALFAAPAANAAAVDPQLVPGNPNCASLGLTTITKFDPVTQSSATQAGITVTRTGSGTFDWSSSVAVDAVIVKGGNAANVYQYPYDFFADTGLITPDNASGGPAGISHIEFCTDGTTENPPANPAIVLEKTGATTAAAGSTFTYRFAATNTGDVTLVNAVLTDPKCGTAPIRVEPNLADTSFDPGDTWNYTCTATAPAGPAQVNNTAEICADYEPPSGSSVEVCDEDTHTYTVPPANPNTPAPAVVLEKSGPATAAANSTVTYTFKAENTGNVTLSNVVLTDNKCESTLVRVDPNKDDATFDAGDEWYYTCTATAPGGAATVDNLAEICGDYVPGEGTPVEVCDEDTHTFTVPPVPPVTPPVENPPVTNPPVVTPPPGGGQLPEEVVSGRARLRGPSGCVKQAFRARVSGREIRSVAFFVDGKLVKQINTRKSVYTVKIRPNQYGFGRHRVIARVRFTAESGTSARRLPLTFRRCGRGAVAPRFTG
ncbi:MAG TPA: hypothetical protein VD836_15815 [Solirubrobacteraceae bacterium]|nr:hypothetical protein [Solirubrobacteraceae bacterium]